MSLDDENDPFLLKVVASRCRIENADTKPQPSNISRDKEGKTISTPPLRVDRLDADEVTRADSSEREKPSSNHDRSDADMQQQQFEGHPTPNLHQTPGAHAVGGIAPIQWYSQDEVSSDDEATVETVDQVVVQRSELVRDQEADVEVARAQEEVLDAKVLPDIARQDQPRGWTASVVAIVFFLTAGLALFLVLRQRSSNSTSEKQLIPDQEPTTLTIYPPYTENLSYEMLIKIQEYNSSLYKANAWMLQDPYLDTYSPKRQHQRLQMAYFYFHMNGQDWLRSDHWLSYTVSECHWFNHNSSLDIGGWNHGVEPVPTCDDDNNIVVFNLSSNNVRGRSPVRWEGISLHLRIYDVSENNMEGPFPGIRSDGADLEVLIVSNNKFAGPLISGGGFGSLSKVRIMKLDGNQLAGRWKYEFLCYLMPNLEIHNVTGNLFDATLSSSVQNCKHLTYVGYGHNRIIGTIPSEFGLLSNLKTVDLAGNSGMNGTIPAELGLVPQLALLDISGTGISGKVPESLCSIAEEKAAPEVVANCSMVECCGA